MAAFTITITLSAVIGAQALYSSPEHDFKDYAACEREVPRIEKAVQAIINRDPDSLTLFGFVSDPITRAYFVTEAECDDGQDY
jgi:hypothetical protein